MPNNYVYTQKSPLDGKEITTTEISELRASINGIQETQGGTLLTFSIPSTGADITSSETTTMIQTITSFVKYGSGSFSFSETNNVSDIRARLYDEIRQVVDDKRNNARCMDCSTACSRTCSVACYSFCGSWACSNSCSGGCITSCSASCGASGNCSGICTGGCSNTVYFWCSGCGSGCSGHGCAAGCSSGCRGCSGSCYASCSNDCNTTCSVTCGNASCNNTCSKSCYNSCDVSCYSLCSGSNRMGTDAGAL